MSRKMNRLTALAFFVVFAALAFTTAETAAQEGEGKVTLTVQLRAADGEPFTGEPVVLERLPDEDVVPPACRTNAAGTCTWPVARGLYQVLFAPPLDGVSALALAEGGLRGFGLTVGDEAVTYHFTFHDDGRVYFDAAPEAARPVPIIPTPELLMGGVAPTATPAADAKAETGPATVPEDSASGEAPGAPLAAEDTEAHVGPPAWRFILYLALGLTAGGGLHLYSRRKQRPARRARDKGKADA